MKDVLIYTGIFGAGVSAVLWGLSHFTPLDKHEALASDVKKIDMKQQYQNCMSEYYWLKGEARKHEDDLELRMKVRETKEGCDQIKKVLRK